MDNPGKISRKGQVKKYFIDNESETEDYEISLKKQNANQINDKSLLRKKGIVKKKRKRIKNHFSKERPPKSTKKENI